MALPTIAGLAGAIRDGRDAPLSPTPDLAAEAKRYSDVQPAATWEPRPVLHVFLTGATGFLGVHLLAELLDRTDAHVHCLVRAPSEAAGRERLLSALKSHGLWRQAWSARVVAVPGELDRPRLGLGEAAFDALAARLDVIYHNGALVNFVYPYARLKQVNVLATADVLQLATALKTKPVHYVSTVGVLDRAAAALPETLSVALHDRLMGGYEQSKWVAEQLVVQAAQRGVPVTIHRPSRIVGHSVTGRMNTDDLFCRLIKGIVQFGQAPINTGFDNMLPVDVAARMIVEVSLHPGAAGHAVHVVNPSWNAFDEVVDFIESRGHALVRTDYPRWLAALGEHVRHDTAHPLAMLMPVLRKLDPVADPTFARPMPIAFTQLTRWAPRALAELPSTERVLAACFSHLYEAGDLPRPLIDA